MSVRKSKYQSLPEKDKARIRKHALAYYHRNKVTISIKRKIERDTNPEYKVKRKQREDSPKYRKMRQSYYLGKIYGLTLENRNKMYVDQSGKCAICRVGFASKNSKHMHVDHNHKTGQIRQLLCNGCNCALGNLHENIDTFKRAVKYLTKWSKK